MMAPINLALAPIYMKLWVTKGKAETQAFLSDSLDYFLMAAVGFTATVMVTAHDALIMLASRKYQPAEHLLPVLVAGLMLYTVVMFLYAGLFVQKKTGTMASLVTAASVFNVLMNILLLPRIGVQGAAYATLASYAFLVVIAARASNRILPLNIQWTALGKYVLASLLAVAAASCVQFGVAFANVVGKGTVSLATYAGLLWILDPRIRSLVLRVFKPLSEAEVICSNRY
jgi:O-antigen/teichoic acid export membrane protein